MDKPQYTGYDLSRAWFDYCFENPEQIKPIHTALFFFSIEHCNRLGWKEKFGLPTQMAMDAIGVKNWRTYSSAFEDLVNWGFFIVHQRSKNQYSATVIAIAKNTKALSKALSKAIQNHSQKHSKSIAVINKPITNNNKTLKQEKKTTIRFTPPNLSDVKSYCLERNNLVDAEKWFNYYTSNGWMVGKNKMKDWKAAVRTWEKNSFGTPQPQQSILTPEQLRDMNFRNQRRKIEGKEPFTPESYFKVFKGANTKGMDDNGMVW